MDYFISLELAAIGLYLVWLGRRLVRVIPASSPPTEVIPVTGPAPRNIYPVAPAIDSIEIVKIHENGAVTKVRDESLSHPDIETVWDTPCLGIRYPDGHIQMLREEGK